MLPARIAAHRTFNPILRALALTFISIALAGCGSRVTAENFAKIQPGQSEAEVVGLLGAPSTTETESSAFGVGSKKTWKNGDKGIVVLFLDGKVFQADKNGF